MDFNSVQFKRQTVEEVLDRAASMGYNAILWEIENKVRWSSHPEIVGEEAFSKEDFRELLARARRLGLRPIPLFQTLGHGEYVLMHGRHSDWMEDPAFPACYCVTNPEVRRFMTDMIEEYLDLFGEDVRDFHLGCDEAKAFHTCPRCRAKGSKLAVFLDHFEAISAPLRARGVRPSVWCDLLFDNRETPEVKSLADKVTVWFWDYKSDGCAKVRPQSRWQGQTEVFERLGFDLVLATASESYRDSSYLPRYREHGANVVWGARRARQRGYRGTCVTSWSVHCSPKVTQYPLWRAAAEVWKDPSADGRQALDSACLEQFGVPLATLETLTDWDWTLADFQGESWGRLIKPAIPAPADNLAEVAKTMEQKLGVGWRTEFEVLIGWYRRQLKRGLRDFVEAKTDAARILKEGAELQLVYLDALEDAIVKGVRPREIPEARTAAYYGLEKTPKSAALSATIAWSILKGTPIGSRGRDSKAEDDDDMAVRHRAAADRVRTFVYNSDGCDMVYYPEKSPLTVPGFTGQRLTAALGTKISTISYCPLGSGFGYFTSFRAGDPLTNSVPQQNGRNVGKYNATLPFWEKCRTDALEMTLSFARTNGFERFMSIRMNDSHDGSTDLKKGLVHPFFSPFRKSHPECLMGSRADGVFPAVCRWQWTCCNYAMPAVREAMRRYVREFCENYDMEGIELDFCRHPCFFKSVAWGEPVRAEEVEMMTELVRDIRATTLSYERKKGHPILLFARVPDSVSFCRAIGLDVPTWLKEKTLDAVSVGCYFDLEDPQSFVELAHASGVKCFVSIDESRISRVANREKKKLIEGRDSVGNYIARYAAAMSTGCDGIHLFNLEHARLTERTRVDPRETDGLDKIYFATERGAGGWPPSGYLKDGFAYKKLPRIEPTLENDEAFRYGTTRSFDLRLGDDFAKATALGLRPAVSVLALVDADVAPQLAVNGNALPPTASFRDGLATFDSVESSLFRKGLNRFAISAGDGREGVLRDFAVKVVFARAADWANDEISSLYAKLKAEGWQKFYLLEYGETSGMPADGDGSIDHGHPNDWGMMHQALAYGDAIAKALGLPRMKRLRLGPHSPYAEIGRPADGP